MRKIAFTIIVIVFSGISTMSQPFEFFVTESKMLLGGGTNNTLSILIYESNEDDIIKAWKSTMKTQKAKVSVDQEISATQATLKEMSDLPFNCFANLTKKDIKTYRFNVTVYLGGSFLNSVDHPDKYRIFENFLIDFAKSTTKSSIEYQLKMAKDELDNKKDELSKLEKENSKLDASIEKCRENIQNAEKEIVANQEKQKNKNKEIEVYKEEIKKINSKLEKLK